MNIVEELKNSGIHTQIKYYGLGDMATGISVREYLDGKDIIYNHYNNFEISNIDSFIDYVYLENILNYKEVIPYVIEEKKKDFEEFIKECEKLFSQFDNKKYIYYIINNYKNIFEYKNEDIPLLDHDLREYLIINIYKFIEKNDEIVDYLIDNQIYMLIDNFEIWQKYFKKHPKKIEKLFKKDNLEKIFYMRYQEIFDILIAMNNISSNKCIVAEITLLLFDIIKDTFFGIEDDNRIWESYYILNDSLHFFRKVESAKSYEIEKELTKQKKIFNDNIMRNGQSYSFKMDLKPFKDYYENKENSWQLRILSITHSKNINNELKSFLENAINNKNDTTLDFFTRKNPGTDEYFTNSRLRNLNLYTFEVKGKMDIILSSEDNIKDYIDSVYEEIKYICKNLNTDEKYTGFNKDIEMLFYYLINIKTANQNNNIAQKNLYYGLSMFICGYIEKVLRIVFKQSIDSDIYVADKNIVLNSLLNNADIIQKIIGYDQCQCLRYLLTKIDSCADVGRNIRNDLAHLNGETMDKLNYDLVLELLSYFTSLINTITLYYNDFNLSKKSN